MLVIEHINSLDQLEKLGKVWNSLLTQSSSDNIFLTWEWMFNWWSVYSGNKELFLVILRDSNQSIVAIAPLYKRKIIMCKGLTLEEIRFMGTGEDVSPDYLNFIVKKDWESEAIDTLIHYFHSTGGWHVLNLTDMLPTSPLTQILKRAARDTGLIVEQVDCARCPYIRLPSSWESYLSRLSKNTRYNVRRRMRNLEKHFKTRYFVWQNTEELEIAMQKLASLHKERWSARVNTNHSFSTDEYVDFHLALARHFARNGWLQLSCLELDGKITGILYEFCYGNKVYYYQGGFDPSYYKYSLGLVLRAYVIQKAIEDGLEEIDLLKGAYDHKYMWTDIDRSTISLIIGNTTFTSKLYLFDIVKKPQLKAAVKRVLPKSFSRLIGRLNE